MSEEQLLEETSALLEDYLQRCLRPEHQARHDRVAEALWRVAGEMRSKNREFFDSCEQLEGDPRSTLERVSARLPEEGGLNWGRVIGLIVFTGVLLQRHGDDKSGTPRELTEVLSRFLVVEHLDWFQKNGGWEGFYKFCSKNGADQAQENSIFSNALMAAAGVGIVGLAFLLTVR